MSILPQIHIITILIYFTILHIISKSIMIGHLAIELTLIRFSYFKCSHVYMIMVMVFNVTFNNMSVISWRLVLLMGETTNLPHVTGKLYYLKLYRVHFAPLVEFGSATLGVICTDCHRSNYHRITTTCCYSFKVVIVLIIGKTMDVL